jgi:hypothetical protein
MWKSGAVFAVLLLVSIVIAAPPSQAVTSTPFSAPRAAAPATVHIKRNWSPPYKIQYAEGGLGTVVGAGLILTHNHFSDPGAAHLSEVTTFTDPDGRQTMALSTQIQIIRLKGDITLLHLPVDVACRTSYESTRLGAFGHVPTPPPCPQAQLATSAIIMRLHQSDRLAVNYRDKATKQLVQDDFEILSVNDGLATLADLKKVIGAGDSGGGVYFGDKLVGSVSSINCYVRGLSNGSFNVTLLSLEINDLSTAP